MSCSEDRRNVRKFLDDLLDEPGYQRMRKHLESCEACTQFVRATGSVSSILMEMGRMSAPADLVDSAFFEYEKKHKETGLEPPLVLIGTETPETPAPVPAAAPSSPDWVKAAVMILVFLAAVLAWKSIQGSGLWPRS